MSKHNLSEYQFAIKVVEDFPIIKEQMMQTLKALRPYRKYTCAQHVISALEDSLEMLKRQHTHYAKVYASKGKENE